MTGRLFSVTVQVNMVKYNLVNKANLVHNFLCMFIPVLYISGANMCSSSGVITVIYARLVTCYSVWMTVWFAPCKPDSHPQRVTNTKCRVNTLFTPDDRQIVARNM